MLVFFVICVASAVVGVILMFRPARAPSMALNPSRLSGRQQMSRLYDFHANMSRTESLEAHLHTLGMSWEDLEALRWRQALLLGGLGAGLGALALVAGLGWYLILVCGILMAGLGWWMPSATIKESATKDSEAFAYAFGGWLTLISMLLAGGIDLGSSMKRAAEMGGGKHYKTLRDAITEAEANGLAVWHAFRLLRDRHPIRPVEEMMAAVKLANNRGSPVSDCVLTQAETLRAEQRILKRKASEKATSKMRMPETVLVFMPILCIMFGVFRSVSSSMSGF